MSKARSGRCGSGTSCTARRRRSTRSSAPEVKAPVVLAVGARAHQDGPGWGGYPVDEAALRHGAGVERETNEPREAYAGLPRREPTSYREGWLPHYSKGR